MSSIKIIRNKVKVNNWTGLRYDVTFPNRDLVSWEYSGFENKIEEADLDVIQKAEKRWLEICNIKLILGNGEFEISDNKNSYSISGNEFLVTDKENNKYKVYSPPWNDFNENEELVYAMSYVESGEWSKNE